MRRRFMVEARSRLGLAMERGLAADLARILAAIGAGAADDADAGRHAAAIAEPDHYRERLHAAIVRRCTASAEAYVALTLEQIEAAGGQAKDLRQSTAMQKTLAWLKTYAAEEVVQVSNTVKASIRRALAIGETQGLGNAGIARLIRDRLGGDIGLARARVIARTETHTAANYGSQEAAVATRLIIDKEWAAVGDDRTRPTHLEANGQVVGMHETFTVGEAQLRFPGDPLGPAEEIIQCRCTVLYVPAR